MTAEIPGLLVSLTGLIAVRLVVSGSYLSYVRPGMRLPLLAAGAVMLVLGLVSFLRAAWHGAGGEPGSVGPTPGGAGHDGHSHGPGGPAISWLLVLPLLVLALVVPAPLGADATKRDRAAPPPPSRSAFPPLPAPVHGAIELSVESFAQRSLYDEAGTLDGRRLRLIGFVVADPSVPDGYLLSRFVISCCAADARSFGIPVHGAPAPLLPDNTWVAVEGQWIEPAPDGPDAVREVGLQIASQVVIDQPANPYE
jgi:uncharacterized repeat protein (TIGR03943 family)